jgi:RES domain-containing protein
VAAEIVIADTASVEQHDETILPDGWSHISVRKVRASGGGWIQQGRSAVLGAPSVVARKEGSLLINPQHPDCAGIFAGTPEAVDWDARLFGSH